MTAGFRFMQESGTAADRTEFHMRICSGAPAWLSCFYRQGHATDRAICLGLMGFEPASCNPQTVARYEEQLAATHRISHDVLGDIRFDPQTDLIFDYDVLGRTF